MIDIFTHHHQLQIILLLVQHIHSKDYLNIQHIQTQIQTYWIPHPQIPVHPAPYTPDRVSTTPTNTPITQTQPLILTTQSQPISRNLTFLETNSPLSDSNDETTTIPNTQDTSDILNRPPLPPITTTRCIHIPDPSSLLQYINSCPHKVPTATKTKRKTPLPTLPQNLDLPSSSNIPITFTRTFIKITNEKITTIPNSFTIGTKFLHIFSNISQA